MEQKLDLVPGKFRDFVFTQYNLNFDFGSLKNVTWGIAGKETCPKTGRLHLQGAVRFKNPRSHGGLMKELKCYAMPMTKPILANERYCSKDCELVWDFGCKPSQGKRNDLVSLVDLAKSGCSDKDLIEDNPVQYCYHYRALDKIRDVYELKRDWITIVILLIGESGTGKTRRAMEDGAVPLEFDGKFIGGYNGEDVVLFDDIDQDTFYGRRKFFLTITDRYPMRIRILGGYRNWKPRKIYFTQNREQYDDMAPFWSDPAVKRRITKVEHMSVEQK